MRSPTRGEVAVEALGPTRLPAERQEGGGRVLPLKEENIRPTNLKVKQ